MEQSSVERERMKIILVLGQKLLVGGRSEMMGLGLTTALAIDDAVLFAR